MRNYLAAECYKTFRRKYFYIILAVCLGLEAVLLVGLLDDLEVGQFQRGLLFHGHHGAFHAEHWPVRHDCDRRYRILRAI